MWRDDRDVTVVIVTYNSGKVLASCLESVADVAKVVVVDNASDDDTRSVAFDAPQKVQLIVNVMNLGFGRACNRGLAEVTTPFVLFLNPDVRLDPSCLSSLLSAAAEYPDAGIFGPALRNVLGITVVTHDNWSLKPRPKAAAVLPEGPCCVEFLLGAALLCKTDVVRSLGGFDESVFLFFEDEDLCRRVRLAGSTVLACPQAHAVHLYGRSSAPTAGLEGLKAWHMSWSRMHMLRKHLGRNPMLVEAAMRVLFYGSLVLMKLISRDMAGCKMDIARMRGVVAYLRGKNCFECVPPGKSIT